MEQTAPKLSGLNQQTFEISQSLWITDLVQLSWMPLAEGLMSLGLQPHVRAWLGRGDLFSLSHVVFTAPCLLSYVLAQDCLMTLELVLPWQECQEREKEKWKWQTFYNWILEVTFHHVALFSLLGLTQTKGKVLYKMWITGWRNHQSHPVGCP